MPQPTATDLRKLEIQARLNALTPPQLQAAFMAAHYHQEHNGAFTKYYLGEGHPLENILVGQKFDPNDARFISQLLYLQFIELVRTLK